MSLPIESKDMHAYSWEDAVAHETEAFVDILIFMNLDDLLEIDDYFLGDFCLCPLARQAMILKWLQIHKQYLCIKSEKNKSDHKK